MKIRSFKKINIFLSVIFAILLVAVVYVLAFRGSIPSYSRDELGIYMPYFSADYSDVYNGFTDSHRFYIFKLNKSEIKKVKADIENNSAWLKFTGDKDEFTEIFTFFEEEMNGVDVNNCYVAVYLFSSEEFVKPKDVPDRAVNIGCSVFDETNGKYYYYEMIW